MATDLETHAVDTMTREELIETFRGLNAENAKLREAEKELRCALLRAQAAQSAREVEAIVTQALKS